MVKASKEGRPLRFEVFLNVRAIKAVFDHDSFKKIS